MKLDYKKATIKDVSLIYQEAKQLIVTYETNNAIDLNKVLMWVRNKINNNIDQYTTIYLNDVKIGYYRLVKVNQWIELDDFYLFEPYRQQGIGSMVLNKICTDHNETIFLYVFNENKVAISLYQKYGFVIKEDLKNGRSIMIRKINER